MTYTYIYRIDTVNYIGSCKDIQRRQRLHNRIYNNKNDNRYNLKVYNNCRKFNVKYIKLIVIKRTKMANPCKLEQWYINKFDSINNGSNGKNVYLSPEQKQQYQQQYQQHYQQDNKEYFQQHYHLNKQKLNEKFQCNCGGSYSYQNKLIHFKTKKHILFLNTLE
jgi:hypothetical protein